MGHLFQPTRCLCVDSMCYTDIVYVPLFYLYYIRAFKLNNPLHKFISPTFTWVRLIDHATIAVKKTNLRSASSACRILRSFNGLNLNL